MTFNSLQFIVFFIVVTTLYFALKHRWRWLLLLVSSCFFYMCFIPEYILILFVTILIDYYAAIIIESSSGRRRKYFLLISILSTCAVLFLFKYYNFFISNTNGLLSLAGLKPRLHLLNIILPIGLSFHTFQSLSYVIEVYRGHQQAEKRFGIYSLYVMFYPQLVAGPIERPQNLLHQFYTHHSFNYDRVTSGLKQMGWGMIKKVVIADRLAYFVNMVYDNPGEFHGFQVILATYFFAIQIYCDFSGYSDIALGAAKVMGFSLMDNFRTPYFSKSVSEFWTRWHISLSTWFKDYVYIPLGGNRGTPGRVWLNLLVTFLISGLWHGANWTYVIWGGLNGIYLILENTFRKKRNKTDNSSFLSSLLRGFLTFNLISLTWVFFRSSDLSTAWSLIKDAVHISKAQVGLYIFRDNAPDLLLSVGLIGLLLIVDYFQARDKEFIYMRKANPAVRWSVYFLVVFLLCFFGVYHNKSEFIYFQF